MDGVVKIFVGAYFVFLLYQILTKGFRGSIFGGRIKHTYGEVMLERGSIVGGNLKIHRIDVNGNNLIGIEVIKKSPLGFQTTPALLSPSQAKVLAALLERASNEK